MTRLMHRSGALLAALLLAVAVAAVAAPGSRAKSYTDVSKSHWAHAYIASVTERSASGHRLLDDYGTLFKPEAPITRELLARSLVLASGHYLDKIAPVAIKDVSPSHRYYRVIQMAVHRGYMSLNGAGEFNPDAAVRASTAEASMVRWLKERYATYDWTLLASLAPSRWEPVAGWKTGAPSYLPSIIASRELELRFNHSDSADRHEVTPAQPIDRAEVAYMFWRAYRVSGEWMLYGLQSYKSVTFPALSDRQKQIVSFSLKYIGYPYIWGGEFPTRNSPYGYQKAGGFDCSGFVFYVMKMHFGYGITVNERGAHDMAARAKPRITRAKLKCGDLIFFGPKGPRSTVASIYHAGLYLGHGWFIQSTGSSDGVTLASLDSSSYYKTYFAWGRRVLKASELVVAKTAPAAQRSAEPSGAPAATPSTADPSPTLTASPAPAATPPTG
jgi:cell wall-associated NlpC family hydrolase